MKTFSELSPQKRLLNHYEQFTPAKVQVGCEINGWLQTHKKTPVPQKRKPPKCFHSRFNAQKKMKQNILPISKATPNYHTNLLSITKLKNQIEGFSTQCKTSAVKQSTNQSKKQSNPNILKNIDVSAFDEINSPNSSEKKQNSNPVKMFFQMHQVQQESSNQNNYPSFTQRIQQRKKRINKILSYNKIKSTNKPPQTTKHISDFSRKLSLINRSQQIVKGNLSINQKQALNLIVKHGNFNFITQEDRNCAIKHNSNTKMTAYRFFGNHIRKI